MRTVVLAALMIGAVMPASPQTVVNRIYEYDALGRLTKVRTDGGLSVNYTYDAADNRMAVTANPPNPPPPPPPGLTNVAVIPINGFLVIPIN